MAPTLAVSWQSTDNIELYADYGDSFHSNDVGGSHSGHPASGNPTDPVPVLVRAPGGEFSARIERGNLTGSAALFYLDLASELIFVGDAGSNDPNNASHRVGTEVTVFWRPSRWFTIDASFAATRPRFKNVSKGQGRIPAAVENVVAVGTIAELGHGLSGSVRLRHFGAAPLIEDDSQRSRPTTLVNLGLYNRTGPARFAPRRTKCAAGKGRRYRVLLRISLAGGANR